MRYRLMPLQGSETFQRIMTSRRWVGRVWQHADGSYHAQIGTKSNVMTATGHTAVEAFEAVIAKKFGFDSADALRDHNRNIRQQRNAVNSHARALARRYKNARTPEERKAAIEEMFAPLFEGSQR